MVRIHVVDHDVLSNRVAMPGLAKVINILIQTVVPFFIIQVEVMLSCMIFSGSSSTQRGRVWFFFCGRRVIIVTDGDGRRVSTIVQLTRVRQFAKQNFADDWIIVCMMHGL